MRPFTRHDIPAPAKALLDAALTHDIIDAFTVAELVANHGTDWGAIAQEVLSAAWAAHHHNAVGFAAVSRAVDVMNIAVRQARFAASRPDGLPVPFVVPVHLQLTDLSDAPVDPPGYKPTQHDAIEVVRVAMQGLHNDGYESDRINIELFMVAWPASDPEV